MQLKLKKGPQDLEQRVLKQGMCCVCGGCMGLCPYFIEMKEHVVLMEPCGLTEGRCYDICPRTEVNLEDLNKEVFGHGRDNYVLGSNKSVLMSQSRESSVRERGQYGGTVTSLLIHGLESGEIDGALMAGESKRYGLLPEPVLAKSADDVLGCTGSKYSACPSLKLLDKAMRECERLAVVGRPCQVTAIRKRIGIEPEIADKISLVIGLFCMWSLDYKKLSEHLKDKLDMSEAKKVDIPYNRFVVHTDSGAKELDYGPIQELRNKTCDYCFDFTSEFADVSVGSTEWKEDWNTLIVRTDRGEKAVESAKSGGKLAVEDMPEDRIELLRKASLGKKKRVLDAIEGGECPVSDYLVMDDKENSAIKEGA